MSDQQLLNDLYATAARNEKDIIAWRHHLHQHPELSNRETKTAAYIVECLKDMGFADTDIQQNIGGTGIIATLRGSTHSEKAVLLRADMDGLPVKEETGLPYASEEVDENYPGGPFPVAHACGHDCHVAMLLGAARTFAEHREELAGTIYFVFQPAEEGAPVEEEGGAAHMLTDAAFDSLDPQPTLAFGMHVIPAPSGYVGWASGVQHASSEMVKITVHGEQVHGSSPWAGRDPMPAAADIISAMGQIYRQIDAKDAFTISIGHVEDQGRFNIIGEKVTLWGTVRCLKDGLIDAVNTKIARTATHIAEAYDCTATVEFLQQIPAVVNAPETVEALRPALESAAADPDHVFAAPASLGYDDVSEFINRYTGMYALLGVQDVKFGSGAMPEPVDGGRGFAPNHSPRFYANDEALITGVRMHLAVALTHLETAQG
ncbi:M20 metallopeptidase family protein [Rothia nasimurium]|uniref:M20 metallopeptidase family protein n=1 Tax=Rothia nasimurium TaxID=85336 RepID=UPI001F004940|nr:amidohydrolase [Rothia nasimurium]